MKGKKIAKNSIVGTIYTLSVVFINFFTRRLFIVYLGEELLGLSALYAHVLDLLNLADLGLGVAVQYQLFKPLVEQDWEKQSRILSAAKKIYTYIGLFIFAAGIILAFFIEYLIKETTYPIWFIRLSFMISVLGVAIGYFFAHLRIYLQANEQISTLNVVDLFTKIVVFAASAVSLIYVGDYFLYLIINTAHAFLANACIYMVFRKRYSTLDLARRDTGTEEKAITANLKNVVPMKLSNYVYNSTDNIIISKILGLTQVALYSNYMTIINAIMNIEYVIGAAVTSSMGKTIQESGDRDKTFQEYMEFQYLQYIFTAFCTAGLVLVCKPFITLWLGKHFLIGNVCFILLVVDFYIHSMYQPAYVVYAATGQFKRDKKITVASAVMNIVISVTLVYIIGMPGVIIGTLITDIYIWIVRSYQTVKIYFGRSIYRYAAKMLQYTALAALGVLACQKIGAFVLTEHLLVEILIKAAICFLVSVAVCIAGTCRNTEFVSLKKLTAGLLKPQEGKNI